MNKFENIEFPTYELINNIILGKVSEEVKQDWMLLFSDYHLATGVRKSMNCRPCYPIVYKWWIESNKEKVG